MKRINIFLLVFLGLFAIQVTTYFTIAPGLLKNKLLTNYFGDLNHSADTAFVRDFYVTACIDGETDTRISHHLKNDEDFLKRKLHVKHIYFQSPEEFNWSSFPEDSFKLSYYTWASRPNWSKMLLYLFPMKQKEYLSIDKKYSYSRQVT